MTTAPHATRARYRQHRLELLKQVEDFVAGLRTLTSTLQNHSSIRFHRQFEPLYPVQRSARTNNMASLARELAHEPGFAAFETRWRVILSPDLVVGGPLELSFVDDHFVLPVILIKEVSSLEWFLARCERAPGRFAIVDRHAVTNEVLEAIPHYMDKQGKKADSRELSYTLGENDLPRDQQIVAFCWRRRATTINFTDLAAHVEPGLAKKLKYDSGKKRIATGLAFRRELAKQGETHHVLVADWKALVKTLRERWLQLKKILDFGVPPPRPTTAPPSTASSATTPSRAKTSSDRSRPATRKSTL